MEQLVNLCFYGKSKMSHIVFNVLYHLINPLDPKTDHHLISPYSNTAELFVKILK